MKIVLNRKLRKLPTSARHEIEAGGIKSSGLVRNGSNGSQKAKWGTAHSLSVIIL